MIPVCKKKVKKEWKCISSDIRCRQICGQERISKFHLLGKIHPSCQVGSSRPHIYAPDPQNRILGGTSVSPYLLRIYAWVGFISRRENTNPLCGASLIGPGIAISAAHCFEDGEYILHFSGTDINNINTFIRRDIKWTHRLRDDLIVLQFDPIPNVQPVLLNGNENIQNVSPPPVATAVGWGEKEDKKTSSTLKYVELPLVNDTKCKEIYDSQLIVHDHMCAGHGTSSDACKGDSGGPLFIDFPRLVAPILVGVTSWGDGCGNPEKPGVWAKINKTVVDEINRALGTSLSIYDAATGNKM